VVLFMSIQLTPRDEIGETNIDGIAINRGKRGLCLSSKKDGKR
jgi:hypothetical protein